MMRVGVASAGVAIAASVITAAVRTAAVRTAAVRVVSCIARHEDDVETSREEECGIDDDASWGRAAL